MIIVRSGRSGDQRTSASPRLPRSPSENSSMKPLPSRAKRGIACKVKPPPTSSKESVLNTLSTD